MKCHRSYLIADFEKFSLDTLNTAKCEWGVLDGHSIDFTDSEL